MSARENSQNEASWCSNILLLTYLNRQDTEKAPVKEISEQLHENADVSFQRALLSAGGVHTIGPALPFHIDKSYWYDMHTSR